jgi:uncharacterized protein GlcG (DUF336 family)
MDIAPKSLSRGREAGGAYSRTASALWVNDTPSFIGHQSNPITKEHSMTKSVVVALTLSACASIALPSSAAAQVAQSGYALPLALALEAAATAIDACEVKGWPVSAFVVDTSGVVKVHLKGDHSTIHTKDSAFRKAYTVVTMGPIFGFDRSSAYAETVSKNPAGASSALFSLPDILALPGGVGIKRGNEIVAALGVGGAPGGDRDEACAAEGVAKIAARVNGDR